MEESDLYQVLRPVEAGAIVRDPVSLEPLPNEGKVKKMTTYWRRRLRFGDVEVVESQKGA